MNSELAPAATACGYSCKSGRFAAATCELQLHLGGGSSRSLDRELAAEKTDPSALKEIYLRGGGAGRGSALVLDEDRGGGVADADAGEAGSLDGVEGEEAAGATVEHDAAAEGAGDGVARDEGVAGVAGLDAVGVAAADAAALDAGAGGMCEEDAAHAGVSHLLPPSPPLVRSFARLPQRSYGGKVVRTTRCEWHMGCGVVGVYIVQEG
jgi:hypothetical protein